MYQFPGINKITWNEYILGKKRVHLFCSRTSITTTERVSKSISGWRNYNQGRCFAKIISCLQSDRFFSSFSTIHRVCLSTHLADSPAVLVRVGTPHFVKWQQWRNSKPRASVYFSRGGDGGSGGVTNILSSPNGHIKEVFATLMKSFRCKFME